MIEVLNSAGAHLFGFLAPAVIQNSLFLVGILALLHIFRHRDARFLHVIAMIGLIKLLIPPFLGVRVSLENPLLEKSTNLLQPGTALTTAKVLKSVPAELGASGIGFLLWGTICIGMIAIVTFRTWRLHRTLKRAEPVQLQPSELPFPCPEISFYIAEQNSSPLVLGFFRHRVYLPRNWDTLSTTGKRVVLAHELSHIRRHDHWVRVIQLIGQAVYFYNPLVWLLNRRLNSYREMACDDAAVATVSVSPAEYSRLLVHMAEMTSRRRDISVSGLTFSRTYRCMLARISYQMADGTGLDRSALWRKSVIALLVLATIPFSAYFDTVEVTAASDSAAMPLREGSKIRFASFEPVDQPNAEAKSSWEKGKLEWESPVELDDDGTYQCTYTDSMSRHLESIQVAPVQSAQQLLVRQARLKPVEIKL